MIRKRSLVVAGHATSVSLEEPFWAALREIAAARDTSVAALVAHVDASRGEANLSSALRVFVLETLTDGRGRSLAAPAPPSHSPEE